jgi:serine/threonine protein kinase
VDELGRGGMGVVYKALHAVMGRVVALKVVAPELVTDQTAREMFLREVRVATQLHHPNIVMAYDANEVNGVCFLVLEYVEGANLDALILENGALPIPAACEIIRQSALALECAHQQGMVHRDIKPANLLIPNQVHRDIAVKVADFGVARIRRPGQTDTIYGDQKTPFVGTPDYVSPEQCRNIHAVDIRSDLYSLGCTFYYALTGQVPFGGGEALEKLIRHASASPVPITQLRAEVPEKVVAVVQRLMAKEPDQRYQTPAELAETLSSLLVELQAQLRAKGSTQSLIERRDSQGAALPPTNVLSRIQIFALDRPEEAYYSGHHLPAPTQEREGLVGPPTQVMLYRPPDRPGAGPPEQPPEPPPGSSFNRSAVSFGSQSWDLLPESRPFLRPDSTPFPARPLGEIAPPATPMPKLPLELRELWKGWVAVVEGMAQRGHYPIGEADYKALYLHLLDCCREGALAHTLERPFYEGLIKIIRPWLNLQAFLRTDRAIRADLLARCRQVDPVPDKPVSEKGGTRSVLALLGFLGCAVLFWLVARMGMKAIRDQEAQSLLDWITSVSGIHLVLLLVVVVIVFFLAFRYPRE